MMEEQNDNLQPETIDHVIDGGQLSQPDRQTNRLLQHLYEGTQAYAHENERSLERIWSCLAQSQVYSQALQATRERSEGKVINIKERKTMQNNSTSWGMNPPPPPPASLVQPKKSRPFWRTMGIGLVAAVAVITIVSFMLFSGILRSGASMAGNGPWTVVVSGQQPARSSENVISSGRQVCSFAGELNPTNRKPYPPDPAWSSQGEIAVGGYSSFKAFSANDCTAAFSKPLQETYGTKWSPDGKKVVTVDGGDNSYYVLDNHGNTVAHLSSSQLGTRTVDDRVVWSSDSSKLIFPSGDSIKSMAITGNGSPTTLMTLPSNSANSTVALLSPGGKYALLKRTNDFEIWDVNSGKWISTILSAGNSFEWAFSPDGSLLAMGERDQIQIYSTADGKLQSSFSSSQADPGQSLVLAWSPDGKYLAEGTNTINIYDVNAKKAVATFGQVDAHHAVFSVAWSPDGTGLVSAAGTIDDNTSPGVTVSVWKLS
jgi:WD40 repeat protein